MPHHQHMNGSTEENGYVTHSPKSRVQDMVRQQNEHARTPPQSPALKEEAPVVSRVMQKQSSQETPGLPTNKRITMDLLYKKPSMEEQGYSPLASGSLSPPVNTGGAASPRSLAYGVPPLSPPGCFADEKPAQAPAAMDNNRQGGTKPLVPKTVPAPVATNGDDSFSNALAQRAQNMAAKVAAQAPQKREGDQLWDQAMEQLNRPLIINDLDFSELNDMDDCDPLRPGFGQVVGASNLAAPPPPPGGPPPLPPPGGLLPPPPVLGSASNSALARPVSPVQQQKDVKTLRLFWKEASAPSVVPGTVMEKKGVFWNRIRPVEVDRQKLAQLFESKSKEAAPKVEVKREEYKRSELIVLDAKRSNAINIGLTKLPPPRAIKTAIMKFDHTIMNKEGIEKIITTMLPTEEEKERIIAATEENPDTPLGSAEQFLITLVSIPDLVPRLRLWLFMLDYASMEKDISEPLMDLKCAVQELETCKTFQYVMATLLTVGNFLNGAEIRGFQLDYLAKVPEVKDTLQKQTLVYHLCSIVMEKFSDSTDLYSDLGAVSRCAKVDFDEVCSNLEKLERDCKSSYEHLKVVYKHDTSAQKTKISEFLWDCAQRIGTLKIICKRVLNRYHTFLLYMGYPPHAARDAKVNSVCKVISEFSLEYKTTRDKIMALRKRSQEKRERNKTRGKTILEAKQWSANAPTAGPVDNARHEELSQVLRAQGDNWGSTLPGTRVRSRAAYGDSAPAITGAQTLPRAGGGGLGDGDSPDDEILEGLVKTAMLTQSERPRGDRRKARQFNRKSLRRTRTLKLMDDEVNAD